MGDIASFPLGNEAAKARHRLEMRGMGGSLGGMRLEGEFLSGELFGASQAERRIIAVSRFLSKTGSAISSNWLSRSVISWVSQNRASSSMESVFGSEGDFIDLWDLVQK